MLKIKDGNIGPERCVQAGIHSLTERKMTDRFSIKVAYEFFGPKDTKAILVTHCLECLHLPKHAFILWLRVQSRWLTKDKLQHLEVDKNCIFCGETEETAQYFFFLVHSITQFGGRFAVGWPSHVICLLYQTHLNGWKKLEEQRGKVKSRELLSL